MTKFACEKCGAEYPEGTTDCWRCVRPGGPRARTVRRVEVDAAPVVVAPPEAEESAPVEAAAEPAE